MDSSQKTHIYSSSYIYELLLFITGLIIGRDTK